MATKYTDADKRKLTERVFALMQTGMPLGKSCKETGVPKATVQGWIAADAAIAGQYALAREALLEHWAEEVVTVADDDPAQVVDQNGIARYDSAAVQHQRLRVDSRKWVLSKLKPKEYGDKVTQEHTGADGGPIALAAVDLKNLSDEELAAMKTLMAKATSGKG
jgi:hypothetical protein